MPRSDAILDRLLSLHPKIIDLSLDRMHRILEALGNPHKTLPPVIHVAGTNGKGSTVAYMRSILEAAGKSVHVYTSPHLVRFHERIRLGSPTGSQLIEEAALSRLLEECEEANGGSPITFFEITTAAAFLAFSRTPADYLLLEVGLGGRLDATNVIDTPALTIITPVDMDHQQYLGDRITDIAREKAGILKPGVPCVLAPQSDEGRNAIEEVAERVDAPLLIAGQDWQAYEQHSRLVYQDEAGLLDLQLPRLAGHHQTENAGTAIAAMRALRPADVTESHIEQGIADAEWPARLQRLGPGLLYEKLPAGSELWLDGGHNPAAGRAVATALAELEERVPRRLIVICGMLNTKDAGGFLENFDGLAERIMTIAIPDVTSTMSAEDLSDTARAYGLECSPEADLAAALAACNEEGREPPRVLICGSLYLAGHVLGEHVAQPA